MNERGEEFISCLGNDKCGHEFYDDVDFEEITEVDAELLKYPVVRRYIKPTDDLKKLNDTIQKGGLNENGKPN